MCSVPTIARHAKITLLIIKFSKNFTRELQTPWNKFVSAHIHTLKRPNQQRQSTEGNLYQHSNGTNPLVGAKMDHYISTASSTRDTTCQHYFQFSVNNCRSVTYRVAARSQKCLLLAQRQLPNNAVQLDHFTAQLTRTCRDNYRPYTLLAAQPTALKHTYHLTALFPGLPR